MKGSIKMFSNSRKTGNLRLFVFFFLMLVFPGCIFAEDYVSSDWQEALSYTHQSWDFGNDEGFEPVLPLLPDGEPNMVNDFGGAELISVEYQNHLAI